MSYSKNKPSFFWPMVLIAGGTILLLSNFGMLPPNSINLLWRFWPLLLVIAGLDILLGRRSTLGAAITTVMAVVMIVGAVLFALLAFNSQETILQQFADATLKHETIQTPLNGITSADVTVDLPVAPVRLYPLSDSNSLIEGDINYFGTLQFDVNTGGEHASVNLDTRSQQLFIAPSLNGNENPGWQVGLHPRVKLNLMLDQGSGALDADLHGLDVRTLTVDAGSGNMRIALPERGQVHAVIDSGSGQIVFQLPESLAAKVVLNSGSGAFHADSRFEQAPSTSGGELVWVTDGFSNADNFIELEIDQGSGAVVIE